MRKSSALLAVSLLALAGIFGGVQARAADWVAASSYADAESKWTGETSAYDTSTSSYASDGSNRSGWGAVLKLNYATPVNSDRVRVSTDFGYGVVDKVKLTVVYNDNSTVSTEYNGTVVQDVTLSTLTFTKGLVKSVEFSYHYLVSGWNFWCYDLKLYQCPDAPDPLSGTTLDPTSVNATSAVLHGKVVSNGGSPCYGRFVFWKLVDSKFYSPWRGDLANNQEFTVALSGLEQNAGYSYQVQLAPSATPTPEQIVTADPVKTFTTVKVDESSSEEWVSPSSVWADTGTWENADQAMDDDTATSARFYHQINGESWSPYIHLGTDLQANGIRLWVPGANTDQVGIDIYKDGAWVKIYEGVFTGDTWQQFPFEKGLVTEARIRLHASAGNAGFYWNLMEVDFHQKGELRTTRYFVGAGAWNSAANWSATSGGAGGASVPGTGCVAIFDVNSPSCTLSGAVSVEVLRLDAGFTGVLDAGGNAITIERNRGFGELRVAGGELKLGSATHTIKDNFRFTGGTITPGTSMVGFLAPSDGSAEVAGSLVLNNVRFYHSNSGSNHKMLAINGTVTANSSLALEGYDAGGWDLYLNGGEIVAKGAITGNGKVVRGTSSLTISGEAGDQTQTGLFWGTSGTYTVNKPAGKVIFGANEKFGDPTMSGNAQTKLVLTSEVDAVSAQQIVWLCGYGYGGVKITGDLTAYNVNFYRVSGTGTSLYDLSGCHLAVLNNLDLNIPADGGWHVNVTPGTVISCKGNVTATNVTAANWAGATFVVSGSGNQSVALGGLPVSTVSVEKTGGTVSFPDGITSSAISFSPGSSVVFGAGKTVQATSIYWRGAEGQPIVLRSSTAGQRWLFDLPDRYVMDECYLEWVDVQDSDASQGEPVVVAVAGTDAGNNLNWDFLLPVDVEITTPATSATSPAWVEGTVGPNVTTLDVSVNGGTAFAATRDSRMKWFANNSANSAMGVVLSPTQATPILVTGRTCTGRENSASQSITWTPTDLRGKDAATDSVTIRKGDSLLLTAAGSEGELALVIDADGDGTFEFTGVPGDKLVSTFSTAGTVTVSAKIDGSPVGSLKVVVMSVDLHGPIACQIGYQRTKDVVVSPVAEVGQISFVPADPFHLETSVNQTLTDGARLNLKPLGRGKVFLQARIGGASGPVVAHQEIDEFTTEQPARVGATFDLKSRVAHSQLTMRPYIPDMRFKFVMFGSGATFNSGLTQFYAYTSQSFEQVYDSATAEVVGVYNFTIEIPAGCTSYCFTTYPEQTGSGWLTVGPTGSSNGDVTKVGVDLDVDADNDGTIEIDDLQEDSLKYTPGKTLKLNHGRVESIFRYGRLDSPDLIELTFESGEDKVSLHDAATGGSVKLDKNTPFVCPADMNTTLSLWIQPLAVGEAVLKATYTSHYDSTKTSTDMVRIKIDPAEGSGDDLQLSVFLDEGGEALVREPASTNLWPHIVFDHDDSGITGAFPVSADLRYISVGADFFRKSDGEPVPNGTAVAWTVTKGDGNKALGKLADEASLLTPSDFAPHVTSVTNDGVCGAVLDMAYQRQADNVPADGDVMPAAEPTDYIKAGDTFTITATATLGDVTIQKSLAIEVMPGERMFHITNPSSDLTAADVAAISNMTDKQLYDTYRQYAFKVPLDSGGKGRIVVYAFDQFKNPLAQDTPAMWALSGSGRLGTHKATENTPQRGAQSSGGDALVDPSHVVSAVENDLGRLSLDFTQERYPHCPWDLPRDPKAAEILLLTYGREDNAVYSQVVRSTTAPGAPETLRLVVQPATTGTVTLDIKSPNNSMVWNAILWKGTRLVDGARVQFSTDNGTLAPENGVALTANGTASITLTTKNGQLRHDDLPDTPGTQTRVNVWASVGSLRAEPVTEVLPYFISTAELRVAIERPTIAGDATEDGTIPLEVLKSTNPANYDAPGYVDVENMPYWAKTPIRIHGPANHELTVVVGTNNGSGTQVGYYRTSVASFPFDSVSADNRTPDAVGGAAGQVTGAVLDTEGQYEGDGALKFNGDDRVEIPHSATSNVLTSNTSLLFFAKPSQVGESTIVKKTGQYQIGLNTENKIVATLTTTDGTVPQDNVLTVDLPLPVDQWSYVTLEVRGTTWTVTVSTPSDKKDASGILPNPIASTESPVVVGDNYNGALDALEWARLVAVACPLVATGLTADGKITTDASGYAEFMLNSDGNMPGDLIGPIEVSIKISGSPEIELKAYVVPKGFAARLFAVGRAFLTGESHPNAGAAEKIASWVSGIIPFASDLRTLGFEIYKGVSGCGPVSWCNVGFAVAGLATDALTLGTGGTLVKGGAKAAVALGKTFLKQVAINAGFDRLSRLAITGFVELTTREAFETGGVSRREAREWVKDAEAFVAALSARIGTSAAELSQLFRSTDDMFVCFMATREVHSPASFAAGIDKLLTAIRREQDVTSEAFKHYHKAAARLMRSAKKALGGVPEQDLSPEQYKALAIWLGRVVKGSDPKAVKDASANIARTVRVLAENPDGLRATLNAIEKLGNITATATDASKAGFRTMLAGLATSGQRYRGGGVQEWYRAVIRGRAFEMRRAAETFKGGLAELGPTREGKQILDVIEKTTASGAPLVFREFKSWKVTSQNFYSQLSRMRKQLANTAKRLAIDEKGGVKTIFYELDGSVPGLDAGQLARLEKELTGIAKKAFNESIDVVVVLR